MLDDYKIGYAATPAPLVVKDKVIVGIAGGDYPHPRLHRRLRSRRPASALWRFYTVPGPGEPGSETWPAPTCWRAAAARPG